MDLMNDQMDRWKGARIRSRNRLEKAPIDEFEDSNEKELMRRSRKDRRENEHSEESIKGIKIKIPSFQGKYDLEVYFEWEKKIEIFFDC